MFARVNRFQETAADLDEAIRLGEERLVPQLQTQPGFLGLQVLLDRETRAMLAITYWESPSALVASEDAATRIRRQGNELTGSVTKGVERYEVVVRVGL